MTTDQPPTCAQSVSAEGYGDDCCAPQVPCDQSATWRHAESGAALCDEHEANARDFSGDSGVWGVGELRVSYPAGWARLDSKEERSSSLLLESETTASGLEIVRFD